MSSIEVFVSLIVTWETYQVPQHAAVQVVWNGVPLELLDAQSVPNEDGVAYTVAVPDPRDYDINATLPLTW